MEKYSHFRIGIPGCLAKMLQLFTAILTAGLDGQDTEHLYRKPLPVRNFSACLY